MKHHVYYRTDGTIQQVATVPDSSEVVAFGDLEVLVIPADEPILPGSKVIDGPDGPEVQYARAL